jgi:hypothetical protein
MLTETEICVLEILVSRLLARKGEIKAALGGKPDGVNNALQRLMSIDCVKAVEPIGEKCFVITKKGNMSLREAKNPENRAEKNHIGF